MARRKRSRAEQQLIDLMEVLDELCESEDLSMESLKAEIKQHDGENTLSVVSTAYVH